MSKKLSAWQSPFSSRAAGSVQFVERFLINSLISFLSELLSEFLLSDS